MNKRTPKFEKLSKALRKNLKKRKENKIWE
jgi:hypothetical protein